MSAIATIDDARAMLAALPAPVATRVLLDELRKRRRPGAPPARVTVAVGEVFAAVEKVAGVAEIARIDASGVAGPGSARVYLRDGLVLDLVPQPAP